MLPATQTKDRKLLACPFMSSVFQLVQSDNGVSNGTALWLSGQCLSAFLAHSGVIKQGMRVIELGSGIGLTALCLANMGCNVIASDLPSVISTCLARNIESNISQLSSGAGNIVVRELDWTVSPEHWFWDHETIIASPTCAPPAEQQPPYPFDLIVSADTVYSLELITPFLRTLRALCMVSMTAPPLSRRSAVAFICLERRDPLVVDRTLELAQSVWGFTVGRVASRKVSKALGKSVTWHKEEWEDVEVWKFTL